MLKENNKEVRTSVANINIRLDPGFWTKTSQIQLFYGVWVNLCHLGIGLAYGFPSVQVPQLFAADSDIKITRSEGSWIASVFTLCSPIGCLISGYVADWLGRRVMIIVCQAPICAGWLYTGFAKSPKQVIIGFGCGLAMGPPRIYCTEMSLPNMRGVIGAFSTVGVSIGITLQAGLGKYLNWPVLCYICSVYTVIVFVLFLFLPETPYFVLKTKTLADARATLAHFRARDYDFDKEMDQLRKFKEGNDIRKISGRERLAMLFTQSAYKPFSVIVTYIFISQITGTSGVMIWAVEMLTVAKSSIDVNTGNFLMTLTRLFVNILTSILLFKVGRKPLAQTSAVGVAVTSLVIAIYTSTHTEPSMPPQILFMSYMAFASVGYYMLPFLMASEIYPLQVRGILAGLTVFVAGLLISGSIKLTPTLLDSIGLSYTMVIFGICSLIGVIYIYLVLPETKNLTLQEIEEYYNKRRPTLTSQRRLETIADLEAQSKTNIKLVERKST
ncbi:facilitated trehalose transporter Tret1-2 homolog isoform X2 [Spodoptera frugiperda]|uniref:Facilitated trehalose transporter Tret1-2 homolog isoform X2 n=1 Tax=Spodoptera frugiperda TaxID=7108 RepID=A0A9R0EDK8_SPOFR|nr:facilitated trehalose transporter Tret1-2 homolog isoform X2 [Spodoptera frugiperda]